MILSKFTKLMFIKTTFDFTELINFMDIPMENWEKGDDIVNCKSIVRSNSPRIPIANRITSKQRTLTKLKWMLF